jgi:hypothetical protein
MRLQPAGIGKTAALHAAPPSSPEQSNAFGAEVGETQDGVEARQSPLSAE